MRTLRLLCITGLVFALGLPVAAQSTFVLTVAPANAQTVLTSHGLTVIKEIHDGANCVYLVRSASADVASVETEVEKDLLVAGFEPEQSIGLPELSGATQSNLTQATATVTGTLPGRTLVTFFGSTVPSNYTSQAATSIVRLDDARNATHLTGAGTVAIIDTGADPNHPALAGVFVGGYDFTRDTIGFSELADLDPNTAAALQQSISPILGSQNVYILNPYTAAILDQSISPILGQSISPILGGTGDFGHGTMVAGVVHLVAPTAKIMPLKAFRADGTSNLSDIINAVYYAADNGANVISMSFSMPQSSPGLQTAIQYALNKNIAVVAASGNDGQKTLVFPASYGGVQGIGSTDSNDARSTFSNYGSGVTAFAAPGEAVITTFPGGYYAAGWGTSFSAPMFAGAASLVLQARPLSKPGDVTNALSKTKQVSDMGYGRIDLYQSLTNLFSGSTSTSGGSGTSGSNTSGSSKP
ncbi:MAG TPA: S8 family serine peptidase [Candidatus Angelobacter sp.]